MTSDAKQLPALGAVAMDLGPSISFELGKRSLAFAPACREPSTPFVAVLTLATCKLCAALPAYLVMYVHQGSLLLYWPSINAYALLLTVSELLRRSLRMALVTKVAGIIIRVRPTFGEGRNVIYHVSKANATLTAAPLAQPLGPLHPALALCYACGASEPWRTDIS